MGSAITIIRSKLKPGIKQTVKNKIASSYNQKQKYLNLRRQSQNWQLVLQDRDWSSVEVLLLENCKIIGKKHLKQPVFNLWISIKQISLNQNEIGATGVKLFIKTNLPNLEQLWLAKCKLGNQGVKHLTKGGWPNLFAMNITQNFLSVQGIISYGLRGWNRLKLVWFHEQQLTIGYLKIISTEKPNLVATLRTNNQNILHKQCLNLVKTKFTSLWQ